jgi:hypothetical protein
MTFPFGTRPVVGAVFVAGLLFVAQKTESLVAVERSYSTTSGFSITDEPRSDPTTLSLTIRQKSIESEGKTIYAKPSAMVFKLDGYMPVLPEDVTEGPDSFSVRFHWPKDALKAIKAFENGTAIMQGQLILPVEVGVTSFAGVERRVPAAVYTSVQLRPQFAGPMMTAGRKAGEFLRGLYGAY